MIENKSGISPAGRAVLVKPYQPERKNSLIYVPEEAERGMQMVDQRVVVIEVGPECWAGEIQPRAMPGDKVLVSQFCGYLAKGPLDGEQYRLVNDKDIFAKITGE